MSAYKAVAYATWHVAVPSRVPTHVHTYTHTHVVVTSVEICHLVTRAKGSQNEFGN